MTYLEPLSKPANRPPNTNEKTFEELYTVTNTVVCRLTYLFLLSYKIVFRLKVQL